ncbi:TolC family protein [Mucilaginibacter sp. AW1-3]
MKKSFIPVYIFLLFILPISRSYAQESIMSDISYPFLDKLIATAKQNYPLVKIHQEQVSISKNLYSISKKSWFDFLSFSYIYSPQNSINLSSTNVATTLLQGYQIVLSFNIKSFLEKPFLIKNAKENLYIAQLEQQSYNLTLELDVKTRYFNYIKQLAILRLRTRTTLDGENLINQTKYKFEQGAETMENYTKVTASFTENNQEKLDAEAAVLIAKASLEEIIGKKLEEVK